MLHVRLPCICAALQIARCTRTLRNQAHGEALRRLVVHRCVCFHDVRSTSLRPYFADDRCYCRALDSTPCSTKHEATSEFYKSAVPALSIVNRRTTEYGMAVYTLYIYIYIAVSKCRKRIRYVQRSAFWILSVPFSVFN